MKKLLMIICMVAVFAAPVLSSAATVEKTVPLEARKAFNEKEYSMANAAVNHMATVVEQEDGNVKYTVETKPIKIGAIYGQLTKLFVYVNGKKTEIKKEAITGGEYNAKFTFVAPKADKVRMAVWVDAMDEIAGQGPGSGEQDVLFCFDWAKAKEKKTEPEITQDKKVNKPVGSDPLQVFVDGKQVKFDVKPFATNNRTLVPMRAIFEALGAEVTWDQTTKTAVAEKDGVVVKVQIGKAEGTIEKNGAKEVKQLDVSSMAKGGRTFVPLRFIGEAFGNKVDYKNVSGIGLINIMKEAAPAKP